MNRLEQNEVRVFFYEIMEIVRKRMWKGMDFKRRKVRLGDLLVETGAITQKQLERALEKQKKTSLKLGETLVDEGIISEDDIAKALSQQLNLEIVDLQNINIDKAVVSLVPVNILKKYTMIPFAFNENNKNILRVAMENPLDIYAQEDISIITNYQVEPVVATTRSIMLAIDKYYGQDDVKSALRQYAKEKKLDIQDPALAFIIANLIASRLSEITL